MHPRRVLRIVLGLTLVFAPARAAETSAASDASQPATANDAVERTRALLDRGVELRRQGREHDALEAFTAAYQARPSPRARGQMGLTARALRLYVEAEQYLSEALAHPHDPWVREHRKVLEESLTFAANNLAWVILETNAAEARVAINGRNEVSLPLAGPRRVVAGAVQVDVRALGYRSHSDVYVIPARRTTRLTLHLEREAVPRTTENAPAAPHVASKAKLEPDSSRSTVPGKRTAAYALGATSVVGLTLGGYWAARTIDLKNERDEVCPELGCPTQRGVDLDRKARETAVLSAVGFSIGTIALGAASYLFFTASDRPAAKASTRAGARFRMGIVPARVPSASATFEWAM